MPDLTKYALHPILIFVIAAISISCKASPQTFPVETDAQLGRDSALPPPTSDASPRATSNPNTTGPYQVETASVRQETFTLHVYTPTNAPSAPAVLFKHGFQLATQNYDGLCRYIASHGFMVLGVDTPTRLIGGPSNLDERDATLEALAYARSNLFTDGLPTPRDGLVAIVGHSRGGKVAAMVAAAAPSVAATLLLDPVNGCGNSNYSMTCPDIRDAAFAGRVAGAVGLMGETNSATGAMPCAPASQNYQTLTTAFAQATSRTEWTFANADHMDFTDDGGGLVGSFCPNAGGDEAQVRAGIRTLAVAFLQRHMRNDNRMDAYLTGNRMPNGVRVR